MLTLTPGACEGHSRVSVRNQDEYQGRGTVAEGQVTEESAESGLQAEGRASARLCDWRKGRDSKGQKMGIQHSKTGPAHPRIPFACLTGPKQCQPESRVMDQALQGDDDYNNRA